MWGSRSVSVHLCWRLRPGAEQRGWGLRRGGLRSPQRAGQPVSQTPAGRPAAARVGAGCRRGTLVAPLPRCWQVWGLGFRAGPREGAGRVLSLWGQGRARWEPGDSRGRGRPRAEHRASGPACRLPARSGCAQGPGSWSLPACAGAPASAPLLPDAELLHDEEDAQVHQVVTARDGQVGSGVRWAGRAGRGLPSPDLGRPVGGRLGVSVSHSGQPPK